MSKTRIDFYHNLKDDWQFTIGNKNVKSFYTPNLTPSQATKLSNLYGLEYVFESADRTDLEQLYLSSLKDFLKKSKFEFFLFVAEFEGMPKSRSRSFKGLTRRDIVIHKDDVLEIETDLQNNYSLLAAVVRINDENLENCVRKYFFNSDVCFLINEPSAFSLNFVNKLVLQYTNGNNIFFVDYLDLVTNELAGCKFVVRNGGYLEYDCLSFQVFAHKLNRDLLSL